MQKKQPIAEGESAEGMERGEVRDCANARMRESLETAVPGGQSGEGEGLKG